MTARATEALHEVHTATNDVLKGLREMQARAKSEIRPAIGRLLELHERHAAEQAAELARWQEPAGNDTSVQGTVNKAVVVLHDWFSDLDRDALPAVRKGEDALRDVYTEVLTDLHASEDAAVATLLIAQYDAIVLEIARLPKD